MAGYRKLGRTASQRKALLRNQVTNLLYNGKIVTTEAKAKEIRRMAESIIALGVKEKDNFTTVTVKSTVAKRDENGVKVTEEKTSKNGKKYQVVVRETIDKEIKKENPSRIHARRQMNKILYNVTETKAGAGKKRNTKVIDVADKVFDEIAPKYADRNGGYTRIVKIGQRKGDAAMEVLIELV